MRHAREDYDRIQDPAGLIPAAEPVILFRAQDRHFVAVLRFYRWLVWLYRGDRKIIAAVDAHIERGKQWPVIKAPDMPSVSSTHQGSAAK